MKSRLIAASLAFACWALALPAVAQVQVEAYVGQPFGVGRMTVTVDRSPERRIYEDGYLLIERDGRALYSALDDKPVQRLLRDLFNGGRAILARPEAVTVYFLFQGHEPLDLTFYTPEMRRAAVVPRHDPRRYERLLSEWWREYTGHVKNLARSGEYPMLVENYLTPMLANRMRLELPRSLWGEPKTGLHESLELLAGTESLEAAMQQDALLRIDELSQPATLPLPEPIAPPAVEQVPPAQPEQIIEPIAMHVPVESLYVRFGNFSNYLWLREFMKAWGGNLQNMIQVRSLEYDLVERRSRQLVLKESALAGVLGPTVIADVAFVGFDTFMREGPAFGVLFQARNSFVLSADFVSQRQEALRANPDLREEKLQIAGHEVSFLSTPDNTVRSFYAVDGNFHLVTTSRALVERFYEAGEGKGALGNSAEFRLARRRVPVEREDQVFIYLSEPFFRQLVSPHYRIEMRRRVRAVVEMQLLRLARLAARAEGSPARSIEELIAADLLPDGFAERPDGSRPVEHEGELIDSLRGAPRTFLPVADVPLEAVTPVEYEAYERFAHWYQTEWRQLDPVMIAVKRETLDDAGRERLHVQAHASPYLREHYGLLGKWLGAPSTRMAKPVPGDIAHFSAVMGQGPPDSPQRPPDYLIFGALRDFQLPLVRDGDQVRMVLGTPLLEYVRGYLGAWPVPGMLTLLTGNGLQPPREDPLGYSPILAGFGWQRRAGDFTLLSLKREVLETITPQLQIIDAPEPAQLRLWVGDPHAAGVAETLSALGYKRAREATVSNSRLMNRLSDQLRVPRPESREEVEELLDAELVSSVGGEYALVQFPSGLRIWNSTALAPQADADPTQAPEEYEFPLLKWFRGLNARLVMDDQALSAFVTLEIQDTAPKKEGFQLPTLPGFE